MQTGTDRNIMSAGEVIEASVPGGGTWRARLPGIRGRRGWPLALAWVCATLNLTAASPPPMPMPIDETEAITARWLDKPVLSSLLVDDMEKPETWEHRGDGEMQFTGERCQDGQQSVRLVSPTAGDKPNGEKGRPSGEAVLYRPIPGENWSEYNRLSFWVYPTLPGFKVVSLLVKLHNDGAVKVPDAYGREGLNYFLLKPDQWNHVVWEIAHLARDKVAGVSFVYRLQGNEPGATNTVCFDFDLLELQQVQADYFEGWDVAPGKIAFSQSGYALGSVKTALASGLKAAEFELRRQDSGAVVLQKPIQNVTTLLGAYQVLDFTEIREPGQYVIEVDHALSRPFWIREQAWRGTVWKAVNFFYCERCGTAIPGIHDACHEDWQATHEGQTLTINGGWHDAGDLSQGAVNTAEAVQAMFELAESLRRVTPPTAVAVEEPKKSPPGEAAKTDGKKPKIPVKAVPANTSEETVLAARLVEEAKWGLEWLRKTRFGDGYRVTWATMDYWTDNRLGTPDDTLGDARNQPFENYLAAAAEATAARVLKPGSPLTAEGCLKDAEADWRFANEAAGSAGVELAAAGMLASIELYRATGEARFIDRAVALAAIVVNSQQRQYTDWAIPFTGFFYTNPNKNRLLHYSHRGHEQAPIAALAALCRELPDHPDWMQWYSAVVLHSEYLRRMAKLTAPYGMMPAGIYDLEESSEPWYREQVRNGVRLADRYYLRRFPAWTSFRGNCGTVLSQTRALSCAARLRGDPELTDLCQTQLQWVAGRNPFMQSLMYGEGWDFAPQYTAMSGDMAGSLPVGVQTRGNQDAPYWPAANCYNYKEVWVHPATRWLSLANDLDLPAELTVQTTRKLLTHVEIKEIHGTPRLRLKPDRTGRVQVRLPEGRYTITHGDHFQNLTVLPGTTHRVDLDAACNLELHETTAKDGAVTLQLEALGVGSHRFTLRAHNVTLNPWPQVVNLVPTSPTVFQWTGRVKNLNEPWTAVVIPDGALEKRLEIVHNERGQ